MDKDGAETGGLCIYMDVNISREWALEQTVPTKYQVLLGEELEC